MAQSSLRYDRGVTRALYARHAIPELGIVDVDAALAEICRLPSGEKHERLMTLSSEAVVEPALLPGVIIPMHGMLGAV